VEVDLDSPTAAEFEFFSKFNAALNGFLTRIVSTGASPSSRMAARVMAGISGLPVLYSFWIGRLKEVGIAQSTDRLSIGLPGFGFA
jgi:hypothetical protein